jgi:pimeloyl-ACP methyl ester carboxylesterase
MNVKLAIVLILLGALLAGCGDPAEAPTETVVPTTVAQPKPTETAVPTTVPQPEPTETAVPEPVAAGYVPTFEEAPCSFALPPSETEGETIRCGYVSVPQERSNPDSPTIRLAIVIFQAQNDFSAPDPVIFLSGGPGEKTVTNAFALSQILAPYRDKRDLIFFDQRGVGLSEPALECPELTESLFDLLAEKDPDVTLRTQYESIMACGDRLVAEGHNLSAYNTAENAADVDDIRQALGYERMNLYGGSYGTLLAQTVMRNHPQHLRSVVLGAVLPAEKSFFVHVPTTIVNAALQLMEACATDQACDGAYPDLQQTLYDTVERLNAEPVPITVTNPLDGESYDTWLTGDAIFGNLVLFLYITDIIPVLPQAIHDVANGDYELMTQLSSTSMALFDALSRGMEFSVLCAEDLIGVTPADYLETRRQIPAPLAGSADPEDVIEYDFFGICEKWPVEQADPAIKQPVVSDIPTLILAGEFDPVTPVVYAEEVADHLSNSYLYAFPGVGHNVLVASSCARDIAGQFLGDPTSEPDANCIAEMPGVVFDLPQPEAAELVLEPITYPAAGLRSIAPTGWERASSSTFVRGENALDSTALIIDALPMSHADFLDLITAQLSLEAPPESIGERETDSFTWTLYAEEVQGVAVDFATAVRDEEETLLVLLQGPAAERDVLYETVFLPVVDSLAAME